MTPQPTLDGAGRAEFEREMDAWFFRTNKGEKLPFEVCRHSDPEVVSPLVVKAFASYDEAERYFLDARFAAALRAARSRPASPAAEPVAWFEDMPADAAGLFSVRVRPGFSPQADAPLYAAPSTAPPAPAGDELPRLARVARQIADGSQCINCKGIADEIDAALKDSGGGK